MWKGRTLLLALLVVLLGGTAFLVLSGRGVEPAVAGLEPALPGLPEDSFQDPSGAADPFTPRDETQDGEDPSRVDLGTLDLGRGTPGNLTFRGRVVTSGGVPIPSVKVVVTLSGRRRGGRGGPVSAAAETGTDGTFQVRLLGRLPTFWEVLARKEGLAPVGKSGIARPGRPEVKVGDLVMGAGGILAGYVLDRDGNPLPGAQVTWEAFGRGAFFRRRGGNGGTPPFQALTGPSGAFRLVHVPRGEGKLRAAHPAHPSARTPLIRVQDGTVQDGIRIVLPPGYRLEGQVLSLEGKPFAGAQVRAISFGRGNGRPAWGPVLQARTDKGGKFALPALPAGDYLVMAGAEGWMPSFQWASLGPKTPPPGPLSFTLGKGASLEGRVVDARGEPVEVYSLLVYPTALSGDGIPPLPPQVRKRIEDELRLSSSFRASSSNGRRWGNRVRPSRAGNRNARPRGGRSGSSGNARPRGGRPETSGSGRPDPARARRIQEMLDRLRRRGGNLPPGLLERFRRFLPSGPGQGRRPDPMERVKMRVMGEMRPRRPKAARHPGGNFRIGGLPAGTYRIEVEAPGFLRKQSGPLKISKGNSLQGITLALERVLSLEGKVLAEDSGEPLAGIRVMAVRGTSPLEGKGRSFRGMVRFRGGRWSDVTGRDGTFQITGLSPGKWYLAAAGGKYGLGFSKTVNLESGKNPPPVEVLLPPGARVEGEVTGWRPEELAAITVAAFGPDRRPHITAVDDRGRFVLEGLTPGEWTLFAGDMDPRRMFRAFFRAMGGDSTQGQVKVKLGKGEEVRVQVPLFRPLWGALTGTLFKGGVPAAGYRVRLVSLSSGESRPREGRRGGPSRFRRGGPWAEVDLQGVFFFPDLDAGSYKVEGSIRGRDWIPLGKVDVPAGGTVQVALTWPIGAVEGLVLRNGLPLPGARVRLRRIREGGGLDPSSQGFSSTFDGRTKKDGRYKIEGVPQGSYSVEIRGRDRRRYYFGPIQVYQGRVTHRDFSWTVCDLRVQVVEAGTGKPVPRAFVAVRPSGPSVPGSRRRRSSAFARTDEKGRVFLKNLQEGEVRVMVFAGGYGRKEVACTLGPGAPTFLKISVKKEKGRPSPEAKGDGNSRRRGRPGRGRNRPGRRRRP